MAFPTLSINPVYPLKEGRDDFTIKSATEAGVVKTRARYTKSRKSFQVKYENMSTTDKNLLDAHITAVKGAADSFAWTHPASAVTYTVRYASPPEFELASYDGSTYLYNTDFTLVEV
jgi:hypothetical protein